MRKLKEKKEGEIETESKLQSNITIRHALDLPFNDFRVNLYNYTVRNKVKEIKIIKLMKERRRPADNFKRRVTEESTKDLFENNL